MTTPYLSQSNLDDLGRMLFALLSEVWIMRDRMAMTEALLAKKGLLTSEEIEAFEPSAALMEEVDALRDRIIANVLGGALADEERTVDGILQRAGFRKPDAAA